MTIRPPVCLLVRRKGFLTFDMPLAASALVSFLNDKYFLPTLKDGLSGCNSKEYKNLSTDDKHDDKYTSLTTTTISNLLTIRGAGFNVDQLFALYNEMLPINAWARVLESSPVLVKQLESLVAANAVYSSLEGWQRYFTAVLCSPWLMGDVSHEGKFFRGNFNLLLNVEFRAKALNGGFE